MGRPKKSATPAYVEPEEISQELPEEEEQPETPAEPEPAPKAAPSASATPVASKAEAVRQALAEGNDSPEDGVGFIKSRYGIDMTKQMFSSYKAQQKARDAKQGGDPKGRPGRKPREASAEPARPTQAAQLSDGGDTGLLTDLAAVKHLVERLGAEQVRAIVGLFE